MRRPYRVLGQVDRKNRLKRRFKSEAMNTKATTYGLDLQLHPLSI